MTPTCCPPGFRGLFAGLGAQRRVQRREDRCAERLDLSASRHEHHRVLVAGGREMLVPAGNRREVAERTAFLHTYDRRSSAAEVPR